MEEKFGLRGRGESLTRRSFIGGCVSASAAALGLAACSGTSGQDGAAGGRDGDGDDKRRVTVVMSPSSEPDAGFDPCVAWGCGEHAHEPLIQSTLIRTNEDMSFSCDLATSYECSDDKLTWTFKLRDDAAFSDGEPVRASDAAFTLNTIRSSKNAQADLSMVEEAAAPDDSTLVVRLSKPYNALLYTLAVVGIVPEHAYGPDYGKSPIGSGRYKLAQWDRGQQAILEANPDYYGEAPQIERVVVAFMEEDAALAAARVGQADLVYTSATLADQQVGGYTLESYDSVDSRGFQMPTIPSGSTREDGPSTYPAGNDVTCNLEVRQAVNLALDRQAIVDDVLGGHGTVAWSIGDGMPWASDRMSCDHDPARAEALLEAAGWAKGEDGTFARDGLACAFDLYYPTGDSVRQAMANAVASQLAEAGIRATPRGAGWDDIYPHEFSDPVMWGWGSNSPSDVYELNYSSGTMNFACRESEATDAYLDAALATETVEESYPLWQAAEWDGEQGVAPQGDATWAWLANVSHLYWKREGLQVARQKLQPHGHGWSILNDVDRWSWA